MNFLPSSKKEMCPDCKSVVIRDICYSCGWTEGSEPLAEDWPSVEEILEPHEIPRKRKKKKRVPALKKPSIPDFNYIADSRIQKIRQGIKD